MFISAPLIVVFVISVSFGFVRYNHNLISLLEGIFSLRGAKDASKIMPAWIFAIIGVIAAVIGLFTGGSLGSAITSLIINIVIFIVANNIKKSRISR